MDRFLEMIDADLMGGAEEHPLGVFDERIRGRLRNAVRARSTWRKGPMHY
jgi:hypothetical protein